MEKKRCLPIRSTSKLFVLGFLIFLIGLFLPLSESLIPERYTDHKMKQELNELIDIGSLSDSQIDLIVSRKNSSEIISYGKAIYPRFFEAGMRMTDDRKGSIPDYSYSRLEFFLVGTKNTWVNIPLEEPEELPHGSDVIIFGDLQPGQRKKGERIFSSYLEGNLIIHLSGQKNKDNLRIIEKDH